MKKLCFILFGLLWANVLFASVGDNITVDGIYYTITKEATTDSPGLVKVGKIETITDGERVYPIILEGI